MLWIIFILICGVAHLQCLCCIEHIPVYIWGNQNMFAEKLLIPGLSSINGADFENQIRRLLCAPDTIMIILVAKTLTAEDFGRVRRDGRTSCLSRLSNTGLDKRYYPAVENPVLTLRRLPRGNESAHFIKINDMNDISQLVAGETRGRKPWKFIFVELPDNSDRLKHLIEHDNLIANIVGAIENAYDNHNVISVYTGKRKYRGYDKKDNNEAPYAIFEDRVLLYLPKIKYHKETTFDTSAELLYDTVDITTTSTTLQALTVGNFQQTMTVILDGSPIALEFVYVISDRSWELARLEAPSLGLTGERVVMYPKTQVAALLGVSFNCDADVEFHALPTKPGIQPARITFPEIQMQVNPAGTHSRAFGAILDCTTVGSIPLAMCGAIAAVLALILSVALCWIADIHAPERFDDPDGKELRLGNVDL